MLYDHTYIPKSILITQIRWKYTMQRIILFMLIPDQRLAGPRRLSLGNLTGATRTARRAALA